MPLHAVTVYSANVYGLWKLSRVEGLYYRSLASKKAAIGFSYDTPEEPTRGKASADKPDSSDEEDEEDFEDVDLGAMH